MINNKKSKGFTLIELLVVVAIISLLATVAVTAINNAREKSRDSKRVADVNKILQALELYSLDNLNYPDGSGLILGLDSQNSRCLDATGWHTAAACTTGAYQELINPDPLSPDQDYTYTRISASDFRINFTLEHGIDRFPSGACRGLPGVIINCP